MKNKTNDKFTQALADIKAQKKAARTAYADAIQKAYEAKKSVIAGLRKQEKDVWEQRRAERKANREAAKATKVREAAAKAKPEAEAKAN